MSWIPSVMMILAAISMVSYSLSDSLVLKVEKELEERRGEAVL
jgi:Na+/melibiose symporter-like transporter